MTRIFWQLSISVLVGLIAISSFGNKEPRSTRYTVPANDEVAAMYRSVVHPPRDLFLIEDQ